MQCNAMQCNGVVCQPQLMGVMMVVISMSSLDDEVFDNVSKFVLSTNIVGIEGMG